MSTSASESQLPGLPGFDPVSIQPWTVQVVVSVTVLALCSTGLRLLSRRLKGQQLWWDDWMIVFSMVWNLAVVGFIFAMHSCGMGIHADLVDPADIVMMAKWLVVAEILYAFNLGWTKLSLLLMYYRIFRFPYFKKLAWIVGSFVMAWVVCITFLFVFICVPVEKLWYPHLPGRCINQVGTWIANAASTILTDVVILFMPLPQVWGLRLHRREKIGLTAAFGLGFFVVFASAYRTSILFTYSATDPTYTLAPTVGWTAIEMSAGITSACLPTMLPVLNKIAGWFGLQSPMGTRATSRGQRSNDLRDSSKQSTGMANGIVDGAGKSNGNSFYRLSDGYDSDVVRGKTTTAFEQSLHPGGKGYEYTVKSLSNDKDDADDIPLQSIRVRNSFEQRSVKTSD